MQQFKNIPYFHAKAPTQMLWNAQRTAPYNPMTHTHHDAELMRDRSRGAKVSSVALTRASVGMGLGQGVGWWDSCVILGLPGNLG